MFKQRFMCIQTIYIRKYQQEVPCGRCYECVKRRRNDWYIRCLLESRYRRFTYFGLLTYAQVGDKLLKRDVQLFLKRLRSYGYTFSYFIAGEYGDQKGRPHWHCLFFSNERMDYGRISQAWRGGFAQSSPHESGWIRFEPIRSARSIRYTVKYIYKYAGSSESMFELMVSKNPAIGAWFWRKYQVFFLSEKTVDFTIDGRKTAMPRYFKRRIFDGYEDIKQEVNDGLAAKVAELSEREIAQSRSRYPGMSWQEVEYFVKKEKFKFNEEFRRRQGLDR